MASLGTSATGFVQEASQLTRATGGTQQYPYPSHVNPSGIVSIRLAGKNTYNRWQEQMVCLIESHSMQGFIDGSFKNPKENIDEDSQNTEGETMKLYEEWKRSDSLVKGWIFGSLSKKVMSSVVGLPTAMDVWNKLKLTYGALKGSQQYPYPSHVQPSKFVSMKLSGEHNYCRWQEKMARLIEKHGMQGFIDGRLKNPKENVDSQKTEGETSKYEEWKRSDSLVKGWIFGSLSEDVMGSVVGLLTAMDVWKKLNTTYGTHNQGTRHYPYPSHVQPNDFVSVVLFGQNNYNRWRDQLVCLIESHGMDGFIDGGFKKPENGETTKYVEWKRSDSLVKGWIFGSLNEHVMGNVVGLPTAMDVWKKLNTTYSVLTTTTDNEETQQYPYPSHVKPIHFVSIKLSGEENYDQWREQMVCLIESHAMQGFIVEENYDSEDMEGNTTKYEEWKRSDSLVKIWIVDSLSENIKGTVVGLPTAMDVWKKLNTIYATSTPPMSTLTTIDKKGTHHYPYPSHVQKPNGFVSIKLSGQNNYYGWQEQMVRLLEINGLQGFIDGRFKIPKENGDSQNTEGETTKYEEWKRSDSLVKGLIFGSLCEHVMDTVVGLSTARDIWKKLNTTYGTHYSKGTQKRTYPSHVQPTDFISIVLSGEKNFNQWHEQMVCLIESHGMQEFIVSGVSRIQDDIATYEEWKRWDALVKEWIFDSLSENIKGEVVDHLTAYDVWNYLNFTYHALTTDEDRGIAKHMPLHRAIVQGDWETVQQHLNTDNNALTVNLNRWYDKPLHVAIARNADIQFLRNLLEKIDRESLPFMVDNYGYTPLHIAAFMGNHDVAQMLVGKNPKLLFVSDQVDILPLHLGASRPLSKTFQYLLMASKQHIALSRPERYDSPFEGTSGGLLLQAVIHEGILDVAYYLIKEHPNLATIKVFYGDTDTPLKWMVEKSNLYYSGTQYNFYQRFIYTHVPIDNNVDDTDYVQDIENQETVVSRSWRSYFLTVIQNIYVKLWEITLLHVSHIKHLKEDKVKHNTACTLLQRICGEVGKLYSYSDIEDDVYMATNVAARNNISEAVKEIIMHFPQAYDLTHHPYEYNMIQLAIKSRSEKVYNLLVHDLGIKNIINIDRIDKDENNLLHLAGELPPIHKLNMVSGAALQMQRELQWFKEVEKFVVRKQKEAKNKKQETPLMMFRREHLELRKEGEQWMKKTADSYTITAALIITIVFAAAITVPGGNDDDTGEAIYATKTSFTIFAVSDAISLFTSTTSLLLFLSILTTRYRDEDFLYRLPKRLILGLLMLFLSVTSLMVAFSATLYLTFGQEKAWILIPIAALTCLPITSFVTLQFPLLVELVTSTYGSGIFGKNK